ncbi:hypothetical protein ACFW0H_25150 [Pseudomonas sp. CR3202]|uniref:hypothetical protein n=1 Tax=Pseudomonas sp. CR3202 TaxID=3351532 RepID=UPI003BF264C3
MKITLTKLDVAERQLLTAINLFFQEQDAVSIHTLSEAASQVLHDFGRSRGVKSIFRDSDKIRPDKKKEFLYYLFKFRNFFKHADKDVHEVYEFEEDINIFSLLDAVKVHRSIKGALTPETLAFLTCLPQKNHTSTNRNRNYLKS